MKTRVLLPVLFSLGLVGIIRAEGPRPLPPAHPGDIVYVLSILHLPRLDFREHPTTLREALDFLIRRWREADIDFSTHRPQFTIEYRLPETLLQRRVTFQAKDITLNRAFQQTLADIPVVYTFEPGKLIISLAEAPVSAPAKPSSN